MALQKRDLQCTFTDQQGNPVAEAIVTARLTRPDEDTATSEQVTPDRQEWRADANGDVTLSLWPNTRGEADSAYHIKARDPNTGEYVFDQTVVMPDTDTTLSAITDLTHDVHAPKDAWAYVGTAGKYALLSERYATKAEDTTVVNPVTGADTGKNSAKHHRNKAEDAQVASESARDASQAARDDSDEHALTSERWATKTGTTVVDADSGVDSGEYGAKEYAQGDLEGHGGSAKAWAQDASSPDGSSAKSAKTLASEADTSATNAAASESNASDSEVTAERWANESEDTTVVDASTSNDTGKYSALHHRAKAEDAQTAAESAESGAQTAESNAQSHLNTFEGQYWGAYSSEPSTDPNGNGPDGGDLYFNTSDGEMKVYDAGAATWKSAALDSTSFLRVDGGNAMTGDLDLGTHKVINVVDPTSPQHAATKGYVDGLVGGLDWQESVLSQQNAPPASPSTGDRHLVGPSPSGDWSGHPNEIAEWGGSAWAYTAPKEGMAVNIEGSNLDGRTDVAMIYNGSSWVNFGSTIHHESVQGLQGGTADEHYHLTSAQHTSVVNIVNDGYAEAMDQGVASTSSPTFAGLTLNGRGLLDAAGSLDAFRRKSNDDTATHVLDAVDSSNNRVFAIRLFNLDGAGAGDIEFKDADNYDFINGTLKASGNRVLDLSDLAANGGSVPETDRSNTFEASQNFTGGPVDLGDNNPIRFTDGSFRIYSLNSTKRLQFDTWDNFRFTTLSDNQTQVVIDRNDGIVIRSATGGGQGAGTLNGEELYDNGNRVLAPDNTAGGDLPTSDPGLAGYLWNDAGTVKVSSG